jgi:ferrous iron transport protein A
LEKRAMHGKHHNRHRRLLLGHARRGFRGTVHAIDAETVASSLHPTELESRLLELGFVEGARIEVLHEGIIGRDPIAVRVDNITIAVRRREAMAIVLT